jgi:hypothetical protein
MQRGDDTTLYSGGLPTMSRLWGRAASEPRPIIIRL